MNRGRFPRHLQLERTDPALERPLKKRILDKLALHLGVPLIYALFKTIGWTLRFKEFFPSEALWNDVHEKGKRYVFAFWHGDCMPMSYEADRSVNSFARMYMMASQSRDGELMTRFLTLNHFHVVRGSSSRGGARALLTMLHTLQPGDFAGLAVDAPRGPRHRVNKPGILYLGQRSGRPVVPVASRLDRKWVLKSWDRLEIPKPFARVEVYFGEPIVVPPDATEEQIEALRVQLEQSLHTLKNEKPD
jgi:lysophospholipid acyltransferase (LPLAT)-like uncharacterized protein